MNVTIIGAGAYGTALAERLTWGGNNKVKVKKTWVITLNIMLFI